MVDVLANMHKSVRNDKPQDLPLPFNLTCFGQVTGVCYNTIILHSGSGHDEYDYIYLCEGTILSGKPFSAPQNGFTEDCIIYQQQSFQGPCRPQAVVATLLLGQDRFRSRQKELLGVHRLPK